MQSEIGDLEALRLYLGRESVALLGHSWGGLLALECAIARASQVSHLLLVTAALASREGYELLCQARRTKGAEDLEVFRALDATCGYRVARRSTKT